jgi:hypothetical protein
MVSFMFALLLIASMSMGEALLASRHRRIWGEWVTPVKRHQRASLALKGWSWGEEAREQRQEARDEAREQRQEAREQRRLEFLSNSLIMMANVSETREQSRIEFPSNSFIIMANVSR